MTNNIEINDEFFMQLAIDKAWEYQGLTYPNPAVGAVITRGNEILSIATHKEAGKSHAEVLASKEAYYILTKDKNILKLENSKNIHNFLYKNHNNIFKDCTIYTTLEPCNHTGKTPPCSLLLKILNFKRVVIGSKDTTNIAKDGAKTLLNVSYTLEKQCNELLYPFIKSYKDNFILFKWAQRLNGSIDSGYLSSEESLDFVHKIRDKCDLIIIGGNTVRIDRPTLDARRVNGKAPDVLIYTNKQIFDKSIPLFNISNRKVMISNNFNIIEKYKYILIEGGSNMLEATKDIVDYYLIFQSPIIQKGHSMINDLNLNFINISKSGNNIKIWATIKKQM